MGGRIFIPADDELSIHGAHTGKLRVHKELGKLKGRNPCPIQDMRLQPGPVWY